ncbi:MAG: DUF1553 domain-containing protein [Verrucomicrobia bacterium]|nr:DUF1553 domain-containing protein [Verrucomicrobiota bacterium]MBI3869674.1 DUF1553 domain-containing protein [Verrucomicrobiota bacterium]
MNAFLQVRASSIALGLLLSMLSLIGAEQTPRTPPQQDRTARPPLWSTQPLQRPPTPDLGQASSTTSAHPIDAFIRSTLASRHLSPSPEAGKRALIRRAFFDLTGLPPTPEEVESFVADPDERAYERMVDRLLASPRYGERWGRHWLDVVHFGETHGYDKDKPRPNAWPYRDYVIRALNEDKPYSRFVQEQIAGDALFPFTRDGVEALGFIAAGPWDFIGHEEVPESKIDGRVARHLDRDDMVANTMQTFVSLTVHCAQCHDHKFDPITQEDYYSLQAVFAAVDRTNKRYDQDPQVARRRQELEQTMKALASMKEQRGRQVEGRSADVFAALDRRIKSAESKTKSSEAFGYHSAIEAKQDSAKWAQVDLGATLALDRVALHACKDDFNGIGEGFGFPPRFTIEAADDASFQSNVRVIADRSQNDQPNPRLRTLVFDAKGLQARFLRVTATKLAPRQNDFIFALAELEAWNTANQNVALGAPVSALDSVEAPARWRKANLTDGFYAGQAAEGAESVEVLRKERQALWDKTISSEEARAQRKEDEAAAAAKSELEKLPEPRMTYIGAVHQGTGNFVGTGAQEGKPRVIRILSRGDVQKPGREVGPGSVQSLTFLPGRFDLPPNHAESERRAALARWITHSGNPLAWRSIANRVWQYHFGQGLVDTPGDFGRMGAKPSHPELLDWLACELRDDPAQSLKHLHRLIMTSATYRQSSSSLSAAAQQQDSENRLLWRMNRRKLEAEAIRDSVLFVAGQLDLSMGGPSFQDFVVEKPEHSPHYEYHLHDPEDPKSHRRSVYRFLVRSQQQPFMTTLDCADPSMQVGRRNESVSPLQALALLNNALVISMSRHFAKQLEDAGGELRSRVADAFYRALGRPPEPGERDRLVSFASEHGLANFCRVLFNLNEFAFAD